MRDKVSKNHFQIAQDNWSETLENFLFDFHCEQSILIHFTSETFE